MFNAAKIKPRSVSGNSLADKSITVAYVVRHPSSYLLDHKFTNILSTRCVAATAKVLTPD
jgi:hypothetical protein